MLGIAIFGLICNIIMAFMLDHTHSHWHKHGHQSHLNVKAAYLHILGDII